MKTTPLKNIFLSNAFLGVVSLLFGYSFWYIATINQAIQATITIPLCFDVIDEYKIIAPEKINVTLKGKRIDLYSLDVPSLAAHIDISQLPEGNHAIAIQEKNLFLPHSLAITHYTPSNITITLTKTHTQQEIC